MQTAAFVGTTDAICALRVSMKNAPAGHMFTIYEWQVRRAGPASLRASLMQEPGGRKNSGRWWSGKAAEPLQCRKSQESLGNLRRQSVTPFHGAQKYSYPLAGASGFGKPTPRRATRVARLPLPIIFRPSGAPDFATPAARCVIVPTRTVFSLLLPARWFLCLAYELHLIGYCRRSAQLLHVLYQLLYIIGPQCQVMLCFRV